MKFAYYPGCSLKSSAVEFDMSIRESYQHLGIDLIEVDEWYCCGATSGHMTSDLLSIALPVDTLLWAQEKNLDIIAPCAACFSALKTADYRMKEDNNLKKKIEEIVEGEFTGKTKIFNAAEIIGNEYGYDNLKEKLKVDLTGLNAAVYYGCLLARPPEVKAFDDPENPQILDDLVRALGGATVDWSHKTICCGASYAANDPKTANKLSYDILSSAKRAGAECLVVACPLCHSNLDLNQEDIEQESGEELGIPIFYFSQLLGIAMGLDPRKLGLDKNIVEPWKELSKFMEINIREYR